MEKILTALLGYRKVLVVLITLGALCGLLLLSRVTSEQFVDSLKFVVGTFLAANFGSKLVTAKAKE